MFDRIRQIPRAIVAAVKKEPKARTGPQDQTGSGPMDLYQLLSQNCANGSLWERAPSGNVRTWRSMCENPTIALALAASKAPVKAAEWGVEADEGVPEERVQLIRDYLLPLRPTILGEGLRAVEYGNSKFEVVWTIESGKMVIGKLKPLLTDKTEILKDKNTGAFIGLKNGDVTLDAHDSLVISFDGEAGNLEGKSRLENVRQRAWWPWEQILIRVSQYSTKAAGIIPQVSYPVGSSVGPSGETISNTTIAKAIAANMAKGGTVIMPKKMEAWAEELLKKNIDASKLMSWEISFVEARNQHGAELIEMFKHFETLMVRGLLQPERSLLEGSAGTKAEAQTHGDTATSIAEDMSEQLMRIINWHLVDRVLEANYGPEAKGTVRLCAAPLVDEQADLLRAILTTVLEAPGNIDLLLGMLDLEAAMEQLGLPVKKEAIYPEPGDLGKDETQAGPDGKPLDNPGAVVASIFRAARVLRSGEPMRLNCGTGAGGFQPGNDCAGGGSGGGDKGASPRGNGAKGDLVDTWARQRGDSKRYTAVRNEGIEHFRDGKKSDQWESVYRDTQAQMTRDGVTEVRAFRGVRLASDHPLIEAIRSGKVKAGQMVSIDGMELNSFSEKLSEAQRFASPYKDSHHGVVFERVIPARDVVASHRYQKSFYSNEGEVIAKGSGKIKLRIVGTVVDDKPVGVSLSAGSGDEAFDLTGTDEQRGIGEPGGCADCQH